MNYRAIIIYLNREKKSPPKKKGDKIFFLIDGGIYREWEGKE